MRREAPHTILPRGLNRQEAAEYIGVSVWLLDQMIADGRMPGPKEINSRKVWDRHALDRAFDELPSSEEANPFDGVAA